MVENAPERLKAQGWECLFDGCSLNGWSCRFEEHGWAAQDGTLAAVQPMGGRYLYTREQYEDFILSLEFKLDPSTNSGVFLRWSDLEDPINTGLVASAYKTTGRTKERCASATSG